MFNDIGNIGGGKGRVVDRKKISDEAKKIFHE